MKSADLNLMLGCTAESFEMIHRGNNAAFYKILSILSILLREQVYASMFLILRVGNHRWDKER
jgi:hypothetical protein